jgi:predicted O-methyltransferase YrrM
MIDYHARFDGVWRALMRTLGWDADQPHVAVEVGAYEGSSAQWMLRNMLRHPASRLYCIDKWSGPEGEARLGTFRRWLAEEPDPGRVELLRELSHSALRRLVDRAVRADLLYIDGGHDAPTVLRDLVTGFDLVAPGGVIVCDDYLWADPKFGGEDLIGRPKLAIDAFTSIFARQCRIVEGLPNYQVYIRKTADL